MDNSDEASKYSTNNTKNADKNEEDTSSNTSLKHYESTRLAALLPQILATLISGSLHIVVGITLGYSAVLIPQLRNTTIFESTDTMSLEQQEAWIASTTIIIVPVASLICGITMDWLGRLNTLKLTTIPVTLGWILIAIAQNYSLILIGRVLVGVSVAFATNPAIVYVSEIAHPDFRGSLTATGPVYACLGTLLTYMKGSFMDWRTIAWISTIWTILPSAFIFCIPESPPWHVSKGRIEEARKSLEWLHKRQPKPKDKMQTVAEYHLASLIKEEEQKQKSSQHDGVIKKLRELTKPTVTKPLAILLVLFLFQQFSGSYIIIFNAIDIFEEIGTGINPYVTSVFAGIVRLIGALSNTYLQRKFPRRSLIMVSCIGMTIFMFLSALFSTWIDEGNTTFAWIPVLFLLLHAMMSMVGLLPIPWMLTAELFPLEIRGLAQSVSFIGAQIIMFFAVQSFPNLANFLGGIKYTQWFFGTVSLLAFIYAYIFVPETHGKKLTDIAEYFARNSVDVAKKFNENEQLELSNIKTNENDGGKWLK